MAGTGIGRFASLAEATRRFVQFDSSFVPRPETNDRHALRFESYKLAYEQLRPLNHLARN